MDKNTDVNPCGWALLPFFVFAVFYVGLSVWANDFYKVPMTIAFLIASATALIFNWRTPLEKKVDVYASGMGETNIMLMCLIFILAGAFASVAKGSGAVSAAVTIAQSIIPARLMVAGVFLISCLISLAIGTSCGTIAAVSPIALGFAAPLNLAPALLLGAVVGGSMFGDNLSFISDTTIASALTQDAEQGILTYEDILALPPERIAAADYRALEGVNCIYVETEPDEAGYVERYWVSVSSGLLAAAERECDGAVVYRMAALTVSYDDVDAEDFTLPNGTVLYEPAVAATKEISEND